MRKWICFSRKRLSDIDREEICTLIYYPVEKLEMMKKESRNNEEWYTCDPRGKLIEIVPPSPLKYAFQSA